VAESHYRSLRCPICSRETDSGSIPIFRRTSLPATCWLSLFFLALPTLPRKIGSRERRLGKDKSARKELWSPCPRERSRRYFSWPRKPEETSAPCVPLYTTSPACSSVRLRI